MKNFKAEKALICYPYPQTIGADVAAPFLGTPFVWERADGSLAVVQTWPTNYNDKFKAEFEISATNPDPSVYSAQAAAEFEKACTALFPPAAATRAASPAVDDGQISPKTKGFMAFLTNPLGTKPKRPSNAKPAAPAAPPPTVLYCHRAANNDKPVYVGTAPALLKFLRASPDIVKSLNIVSLTDDGFVTGTVDGKGNTGTKDFSMAPEVEYALYTKLGWHTMACGE